VGGGGLNQTSRSLVIVNRGRNTMNQGVSGYSIRYNELVVLRTDVF